MTERDLYLVPPGHGENEPPGPQPRCPHCASIIDVYPDPPHSAAGGSLREGEAGTCQTHGAVVGVYGRRDEILARKDRP